MHRANSFSANNIRGHQISIVLEVLLKYITQNVCRLSLLDVHNP